MGQMKTFFDEIMQSIQEKMQTIDMDSCEISIQEALYMVKFIEPLLLKLRTVFLEQGEIDTQSEIRFFKEMKPEVLNRLIYFNEVYTIGLKRPNGSNEIQQEYYKKELDSLTYFYERNIDFYQYYRSKSSHLDEYYFLRNKFHPELCVGNQQFIHDASFSTVYDYKVAKILANEMLRIYLNKKLLHLSRYSYLPNNEKDSQHSTFKWTGSKIAAIELAYAVHSAGVFNNGNVDIREIMTLFEITFDIDLGDYYRTYIAIKSRKKERTVFLKMLIDRLTERMDEDDRI
jgi:hypothetical protein